MVNKSDIVIYGIFILSFLAVLAAINNFLELNYDTQTQVINNCKNFNGRDFLLTGGSSKPSSVQEANLEMRRLQWLCNGGSKV